ncbi:MAG: nucleotidyltransferase domain-containing protein [Chromatiales bacterium]|nr:nucleotidyltransferase domain-containing protein [Chromatiales bacterium]
MSSLRFRHSPDRHLVTSTRQPVNDTPDTRSVARRARTARHARQRNHAKDGLRGRTGSSALAFHRTWQAQTARYPSDTSPSRHRRSSVFPLHRPRTPSSPRGSLEHDLTAGTGHSDARRGRPPRAHILFGSHARSEARQDSDMDFLVIKSTVEDRARKMVRLRRALRPLRIPVDVLVYSTDEVARWGDQPGSALYWALREGRIVYG